MEDQFYRQLVQRFIDKKLTDQELEVFIYLLNDEKLDSYLLEKMNEDVGLIGSELHPTKKNGVRRALWRWAVAAMLVLASSVIFYFHNEPAVQKPLLATRAKKHAPVTPGGDKALLVLSDGKQVELNKGLYDAAVELGDEGPRSTEAEFNEVKTPRGGQYQVILPDGSKVFLNSASRIRFPVRFIGKERRVEISGEVFFEVTPNKAKPFRVVAANQIIEVLGTHFNVNAYVDEVSTKTTLLEGSVKVSAAKTEEFRVLRPGQQAVNSVGGKLHVESADIEGIVAWKDGYFKLNHIDIKTLMRQISRWYDIEVEYRGKIPQDELMGKIRRSDDISEVLRILELGKIPFKMEGRKLIVGK